MLVRDPGISILWARDSERRVKVQLFVFAKSRVRVSLGNQENRQQQTRAAVLSRIGQCANPQCGKNRRRILAATRSAGPASCGSLLLCVAQSDTGDFTISISHTELLEPSNLSRLELVPSSQGRGCLALQFGEHGLVLRSRRRIAGTHERPQRRQHVV
jgi:hypothetical protein